MRELIHLVFDQNRVLRMIKNQPTTTDLKRGEFYAAVDFQVASSFFTPRATPKIVVSIEGPMADEAPVVIDPQSIQNGTTEKARLLGLSLHLFGKMLLAARQNGDDGLRGLAEETFATLMREGVDVRIEDEFMQALPAPTGGEDEPVG